MKHNICLLLLITLLVCCTLCGCSSKKSEQVLFAENKISSIGNVSLDNEKAILEAEIAYDQLTDKEKEKVENYDILVAARKTYDEALKAAEDARLAKDKEIEDYWDDAIVLINRDHDIPGVYDKLEQLKDGATEEQIEQLVKYQESLEQYCYPGTLFVKMELIYPDTISDQETVDVSYGKGTVISYFHNLKKGGGTGRDTYAEKTNAAFYEFLSTHYTRISAPAVLLQLDDTYTACFQDSQGSVLGYSFGASGSRGSFLDIVVVRHDYFE